MRNIIQKMLTTQKNINRLCYLGFILIIITSCSKLLPEKKIHFVTDKDIEKSFFGDFRAQNKRS